MVEPCFKYDIDEPVMPVIQPWFEEDTAKFNRPLLVCKIKERKIDKKGNKRYTVRCIGDIGVRDFNEDWIRSIKEIIED